MPEVSQTIRAIFESYTPLVEPISLDEAFLDVTDSTKLFGPAETIGRAIKNRIREQTHLTASVGIAPNKFLAKLASDLRKPDGFVVITEQNKQEILDPLPVGRIWGVGKVTEKALYLHGIQTIGQLRGETPAQLRPILGNSAEDLLQLAHGEDDREVEPDRQCKSLSSEQTFATDVNDSDVLLSVLMEQVEEVAWRLRRERLKARTITLKLRYGDFRTVTRSETLGEGTNLTNLLWQTAEKVFRQWQNRSGGPLRLLGFGASGLEDERAGQQLLFPGSAAGEAEKARSDRRPNPRPLRQTSRPPGRLDGSQQDRDQRLSDRRHRVASSISHATAPACWGGRHRGKRETLQSSAPPSSSGVTGTSVPTWTVKLSSQASAAVRTIPSEPMPRRTWTGLPPHRPASSPVTVCQAFALP